MGPPYRARPLNHSSHFTYPLTKRSLHRFRGRLYHSLPVMFPHVRLWLPTERGDGKVEDSERRRLALLWLPTERGDGKEAGQEASHTIYTIFHKQPD